MYILTFHESEDLLLFKIMGSPCIRGLRILFLGFFPKPLSSDNPVSSDLTFCFAQNPDVHDIYDNNIA